MSAKVIPLNANKTTQQEECSHTILDIGDEWVCCVSCGEMLDVYKTLESFLDADGVYRKALIKRRTECETLQLDIDRLKKDHKSRSGEYRKLNAQVRAAGIKLEEINQTIKERAPKVADLIEELSR